MTLGQMVASSILVLVGGYIIYRVKTLANVQKRLEQVARSADSYNGRVSEAIQNTLDNTAAVRENTEALRNLIAVNRQLLDKQNQGNS